MEQNEEEEEIVDERTTIKKRNLNTIYLIIVFSIIIQLIITLTDRPTSIRKDTLLIVLMSLGGGLGRCILPLIIAFLSNWKKGIYSEKFRKVFVISWIIILFITLVGKYLNK